MFSAFEGFAQKGSNPVKVDPVILLMGQVLHEQTMSFPSQQYSVCFLTDCKG